VVFDAMKEFELTGLARVNSIPSLSSVQLWLAKY